MLTGALRQRALFGACVLVGITLRAYAARRGWNFDTEMLFKIAALPAGANFYREVPLWANWGPIPYNIFQAFCALPGGGRLDYFHAYLATFFTVCDVVSSVVLWRLWGLRAAAWFLLLSPVAITISGFHCNAEPALVAMVLVGYYLHVRHGKSDGSIHPVLLTCLGLSLAFKHAFILFPLWLAFRPGSRQERARILVIPYAVWFAFTLYYLMPSPMPFIQNVLSYGGWSGNALLPLALDWIFRTLRVAGSDLPKLWLPLFLGLMLAIGWRVRRWPLEDGLLLYPIALLVTTSAVALQYFNLASFSIAARLDAAGVAFNVFAAYFYGGHPEELALWALPAWLQNSWIPIGARSNVGWLISQAILMVVLARRLMLRPAPGGTRAIRYAMEEPAGGHRPPA
jgi:hypothetical protein